MNVTKNIACKSGVKLQARHSKKGIQRRAFKEARREKYHYINDAGTAAT